MLFKTCRIRWNIKLIRQKQNKTEQTLKILIKYRLCYHITTLGPRKFLANQSVKMLLLSVDKEEAWWNSDEMSRLLIQDWWVFWTNLINKVPRVPKCLSALQVLKFTRAQMSRVSKCLKCSIAFRVAKCPLSDEFPFECSPNKESLQHYK